VTLADDLIINGERLDKVKEHVLFSAAGNGDDEVLGYLFARGIKPDGLVDIEGKSPLTALVSTTIDIMTDRPDTDPNYLDETEENRRAAAVRRFANAGAKLDALDKNGNAALHYAVKRNRVAIAKALLENGANINVSNGSGATPLMESMRYGSVGVAKLLIEKGAAVDQRDKAGRTALNYEKVEIPVFELSEMVDPDMDLTDEVRARKMAAHAAQRKKRRAEIAKLLRAAPSKPAPDATKK
jgi:ankyrin repeat protein